MKTVGASIGTARPRAARSRRQVVVASVTVAAVVLAVLGAALLGFRYLPALDEARALRADLETMVDRVRTAGFDIEEATVDTLDAELVTATTRLDHLAGLVGGDPLVGVARLLPPTSASVRGADALLEAGDRLLDAVGKGLIIGRRFVAIRDAQTVDAAGGSALPRLVELMATSRGEATAAAAAVAEARLAVAEVPDGVVGQIESLRDAMSERIERYAPMLDTYVDVSDRLPTILGWDGPRRYLVLTQDPAELRPTGGFIGTYAIVSFDRGQMTEFRFQDTGPLDFPWDYPRIEPPQELVDYLLGPKQPWQFADANWSPDFPTSARDALRLYANQSGDTDVDGVIGITTFTIDELLKVTGPISVPEFDTTVTTGETTMKVLERTRAPRTLGEHPKAFLFDFADRLADSLLGMPPGDWASLLGTAEILRRDHLLLAWFADPAEQATVADAGFAGEVREDPGDFVYPVDANVAPVSKLNILTTRSLDLDVRLDPVGNARNTLRITWENAAESPAGKALLALENVGGPILGMYSRVLVPERCRVESVIGGGSAPLTDPAVVQDEAGRTAIGTYLQISPGTTSLTYSWTSPYAADADEAGGSYRLTIQKQPGLLAGPLTLRITVPDGFAVTAASQGLTVSGQVARLEGALDRDVVVGLRYAP